ncbi:MAG: hypothetical protein ABIQ93_04240 [Saprospiraceae bacterium]
MLVTALLLIIYGYLCRITGFFFFWESKPIGWILLIITFIGIFIDRIKFKKARNEKTLSEKIGLGFSLFILFIQSLVIILLLPSDVYSVAKTYLNNDDQLKAEIGPIQGFILSPASSIQMQSGPDGPSGEAEINLTAKGARKFKDRTIYLVKTTGRPTWEVVVPE